MIGGLFDEYRDEVCGAILNVRNRCDKISVWTPNVSKKDEIIGIGWVLEKSVSSETIIARTSFMY
jgi:translation initiation factor 4E